MSHSVLSAGSTDPSVPSNFSSPAVRRLWDQMTIFASRSALQFRCPSLPHSAAAASWSVFSCGSSARVAARSSLLTLLKATAMPGSSTLHSWLKSMRCSSPLSLDSAIATRVTMCENSGTCRIT
jgi:hypothetical protein